MGTRQTEKMKWWIRWWAHPRYTWIDSLWFARNWKKRSGMFFEVSAQHLSINSVWQRPRDVVNAVVPSHGKPQPFSVGVFLVRKLQAMSGIRSDRWPFFGLHGSLPIAEQYFLFLTLGCASPLLLVTFIMVVGVITPQLHIQVMKIMWVVSFQWAVTGYGWATKGRSDNRLRNPSPEYDPCKWTMVVLDVWWWPMLGNLLIVLMDQWIMVVPRSC